MATTSISLIRTNTEKVAPPRALWVPFELGRPLGAPSDPSFQRRVLVATLDLLEAPEGPVLVDFPDDAPETSAALKEDEMEGLVCLIAQPKLPDKDAPATELGRELLKEIGTLAPWYNLARSKRGRTTVGPSGLNMDAAAKYLAAFLEDQATSPPRDDIPAGRVLKLSYEDLKAYYGEAITVQPGFGKSGRVEDWIFNETVLGRALWRLQDVCAASDDEYYRYLSGKSIIPDRQVEKLD
ncbi:MAG: hypothetical protein JXQ99_14525 [Hyphomicrobiaceae bacterium]